MKKCSNCKKMKPLDEFYKNMSTKVGPHKRAGSCKICQLIRQRSPEGKAYLKRYTKELRRKLRIEIINHYSNGTMECACCKESHIRFLCIDHINGGGKNHEKERKGIPLDRWLKMNKFPEGYRILCWNCNSAIGLWGICPHKEATNDR